MSNYVEAYVIVEGPTEQSFVRGILAPQLGVKNVFLEPSLIGKPGHKGGRVSLQRAITDIENFLKQRSNTLITTMFDYYGLAGHWPGRNLNEDERRTLSASQKAQKVESGLFDLIQKQNPSINVTDRFIPFFVMHEFEGLLFSDPAILAQKLSIAEDVVRQIVAECGEPEEINDSTQTAPSKRLDILVPGKYRKTTQGIAIARAIGLTKIRQASPHFNRWVNQLENFAQR